MNVTVSVIIPIYNVEKYLSKCLDSTINQTYKNLEIICVNDCSPDNSSLILEEYAKKDDRIIIFNRKQNGGIAAARNSGLEIATGEYIYFIDADDWIDLDYIEKMVDVAKKTHADIVANRNIMTEFDNLSQQYFHANEAKLTLNSFISNKQGTENVFWTIWSKLYKTSFLKDNNLTFPVGYIYEDLYFHYTSFAMANKIYYTKQSYYHYLDRNSSISKTDKNAGVNYIKVYNLIYDFYKEHNLLDKKIKIYSTIPSFNIKDENAYTIYKSYFDKTINYINNNSEIFNELDLYFANNVANSASYEDYISKFPKSATISFLRRKK